MRAQEALGITTGSDDPLDAAEEPDFRAEPAPRATSAADGAAAPAAPVPERRRQPRSGGQAERLEAQLARARLARCPQHGEGQLARLVCATLAATAQVFYDTPPTTNAPETGWQLQFVLSVPIFDGGLRRGQRQEREALADQSEAALEGTLRQVRSDVRLGLEALGRQERALAAARRTAERARVALDLTSQGYRAGVVTDLDVTTAQQQAREADLTAVASEDAVRQAHHDLLIGLGQFP